MLTKCSKKMTSFFILKNSISEGERDVYDYCFEIFLSTIANLAAIIIIAIATGTYLETLSFIMSFMVLRACAGGYHADTHFRCFLILMFVYGMFLILLAFVSVSALVIISLLSIIISNILAIFIAPVEHFNNQMSKIKRGKLRIKSLCLVVGISIVTFVLLYFKFSILGFSLVYGITAVLVSCLLGMIKNKLKKGGTQDEE